MGIVPVHISLPPRRSPSLPLRVARNALRPQVLKVLIVGLAHVVMPMQFMVTIVFFFCFRRELQISTARTARVQVRTRDTYISTKSSVENLMPPAPPPGLHLYSRVLKSSYLKLLLRDQWWHNRSDDVPVLGPFGHHNLDPSPVLRIGAQDISCLGSGRHLDVDRGRTHGQDKTRSPCLAAAWIPRFASL